MRTLNCTHKGLNYEFRLFDRVKVMEVWKAGEHVYTVRYSYGRWACNCPGHTYRHECWHTSKTLPLVLASPPATDFEAAILEDVALHHYGKGDL